MCLCVCLSIFVNAMYTTIDTRAHIQIPTDIFTNLVGSDGMKHYHGTDSSFFFFSLANVAVGLYLHYVSNTR